jgi:ankyrin repeat protein
MLIDNQFILNIMIHVCILFIFLYTFFFLFISKKGEDVLNENIKSLSNDSVNEILKEIDEKFGKNIDWKNLREKCLYIKNNPNNEINKWVNEEDITGNTALYHAINKGDTNLIKLLLANRAVIRSKHLYLLETKKNGIKFLKPNPLSSTVINEIEQILANHK